MRRTTFVNLDWFGWVALFMMLQGAYAPGHCAAYSILTHEEVVDLSWNDQIKPVLLRRFATASEEELRQAHAYAYGGCLVQDLGYYPFGSKFFSDLTHYARSGDFVRNLLRSAATLNEYAFALGAAAHYTGDCTGHPVINHAVALSFPKLHAKFGDEVTYMDDPQAHLRTEFGFDMTQVAKHRYASDRYHNFIGFEIAEPLLDRAFAQTYGLRLDEVLGHVGLAIGTFRRAVSQFIPELTKAALTVYRPELVEDVPSFDERKFLYNISRAEYEREWGTGYRRPSFLARFLAFLLRILPKVGPLKTLEFKVPNAETEALYIHSVNQTLDQFKATLAGLDTAQMALPDRDLDTGRGAQLAEYELADRTYIQWLDKLAEQDRLTKVPEEIRANILEYFSAPVRLYPRGRERKAWRKTKRQLEQLAIADARDGRSRTGPAKAPILSAPVPAR